MGEEKRMNAKRAVPAAIAILAVSGLAVVVADQAKDKKGHMPDMKACHEHCAATSKLIRDASAAVSAAKDSGDQERMRTALVQADKALTEMNSHVGMCMRMMGHMGTGMGSMHGMDHGKAPQGQAVDPVCGMAVDPKTAASATHEGMTYYFCSEEDKARFLKDPAGYAKKPQR